MCRTCKYNKKLSKGERQRGKFFKLEKDLGVRNEGLEFCFKNRKSVFLYCYFYRKSVFLHCYFYRKSVMYFCCLTLNCKLITCYTEK